MWLQKKLLRYKREINKRRTRAHCTVYTNTFAEGLIIKGFSFELFI